MVGSLASATGSAWAIPAPTLTGLTAELGPQMTGATVTFTALAAGGTAPYQFKWSLWDGATWTVLEDWSTDGTFIWTPPTPNPNYAVGVRVRSAGSTDDSPASSGAYKTIAFAIN